MPEPLPAPRLHRRWGCFSQRCRNWAPTVGASRCSDPAVGGFSSWAIGSHRASLPVDPLRAGCVRAIEVSVRSRRAAATSKHGDNSKLQLQFDAARVCWLYGLLVKVSYLLMSQQESSGEGTSAACHQIEQAWDWNALRTCSSQRKS